MEHATIEDLVIRVDDLERENRWMKRLGGGAICALLVSIGLGTSWGRTPRVVTTESLVLTDSNGDARARFEVRPDGAPTLAMMNRHGDDQVVLRAGMDGSSSLDYFEGRSAMASLSHRSGAGPALELFNTNARSSARMFIDPEGGSGVAFHRDLRGVGLNVDANGSAELNFADRKGRLQQGMKLEPGGTLTVLGRKATSPTYPSTLPTSAAGGQSATGFGMDRLDPEIRTIYTP